MKYRDARTWLKRRDVTVGVLPECNRDITWLTSDDWTTLAERVRRAEGKDCNLAGDVVLYRQPDGNYLVVDMA